VRQILDRVDIEVMLRREAVAFAEELGLDAEAVVQEARQILERNG